MIRLLGFTRYTTSTLRSSAMLGPSRPYLSYLHLQLTTTRAVRFSVCLSVSVHLQRLTGTVATRHRALRL